MNTQETLLVYMCHLEEATHSCKMGVGVVKDASTE